MEYRIRWTITLTLMLLVSLALIQLAHASRVSFNPRDGTALDQSPARVWLVLSEGIGGAYSGGAIQQNADLASTATLPTARALQPTAMPTDGGSGPTRSHDLEPIPVTMQGSVATGLVITLLVVIGVIVFHRISHRRR